MSLLSQAGRRAIARPIVSFSNARLNTTKATSGTGLTTTRQDHEKSGAIQPSDAPKHVVTADVVSGAPTELRHRAVRIFKPTRNTMQSGGAKSDIWRIDWDTLPGAGRWENPLMGWASSADYMQGTRINFKTKEDAIHFAEKQGWDYYVQAETVKRIPPKNYAGNYTHVPHALRIHHTK
ncbi:NADH dehydrogenase (ubiquinone) Fe-S protein 4 [Ceratobasidium sp. AG-Ba]|nr:NADH dehydrogenase (ubiquinone) Fe-S protein 4 [Ceratobasidium sp. AG-Ba]